MHRCSSSDLYVYLLIQVSTTTCPRGNFTDSLVILLVPNVTKIFLVVDYTNPIVFYLFSVNNGKTRTMCEIGSKLTIWTYSDISDVSLIS